MAGVFGLRDLGLTALEFWSLGSLATQACMASHQIAKGSRVEVQGLCRAWGKYDFSEGFKVPQNK